MAVYGLGNFQHRAMESIERITESTNPCQCTDRKGLRHANPFTQDYVAGNLRGDVSREGCVFAFSYSKLEVICYPANLQRLKSLVGSTRVCSRDNN